MAHRGTTPIVKIYPFGHAILNSARRVPTRTASSLSMSLTPARRSRRDQPVVQSPSKPKNPHEKLEESWLGQPILSRLTRPSEDLPFDEELPDEDDEWTTHFYEGFKRTILRREGKEEEEYSVGDTILVKGLFKDTHVGVIIALWSVTREEEERPYVMLHWFLKPKQLPKTGTPRAHRDVRTLFVRVLPTLIHRSQRSTLLPHRQLSTQLRPSSQIALYLRLLLPPHPQKGCQDGRTSALRNTSAILSLMHPVYTSQSTGTSTRSSPSERA